MSKVFQVYCHSKQFFYFRRSLQDLEKLSKPRFTIRVQVDLHLCHSHAETGSRILPPAVALPSWILQFPYEHLTYVHNIGPAQLLNVRLLRNS